MVPLLGEIHFANHETYNPANEGANERTNERTNERPVDALVQGRFGMLITDQHTYPSLAPASSTSHPLAVSYLGCQPIRLGTAPLAGLVARRARVRPTSRPYDPRTPRNARFALFRARERATRGEESSPLYTRPGSSSSNRLLCASFDFFRRLTWSNDRRRVRDVSRAHQKQTSEIGESSVSTRSTIHGLGTDARAQIGRFTCRSTFTDEDYRAIR